LRRYLIGLVVGLPALTIVACQEQNPTAVDDRLLPAEPITIEIEIPWEDFASNLAVYGGYGVPAEIGTGVLAKDFGGTLDARTLVRFAGYPVVEQVRDSTGTSRPDSSLTFIGGRLVAFFDTIASTNEGPVTLGLGATQAAWDLRTVSWTNAVDTLNDERPWDEPGAGPVADFGTTIWDPAAGDSAWFVLDSAQVASWSDTTDASQGARIELLTPGERIQVLNVALRLDTRPSVNPDTLIVVTAAREGITFVYDPLPLPPPDGIRIGGVPAWRTILDLTLPNELNGPAELCAVVDCPISLQPFQVNYAAIVLKSRKGEVAFTPTDTVALDLRPVLAREALPKSPLGESLIGLTGRRVGPEAFDEQAGTDIEIPLTEFARNLLGSTEDGAAPPINTLALLSIFEPVSIAFASFHGPGDENAPVLKLIITIGRSVELP